MGMYGFFSRETKDIATYSATIENNNFDPFG